MEYLKGKVVFQEENKIIFESNNIGYCFKGQVKIDTSKIFIHTITNSRTLEIIGYAFDSLNKKEYFKELLFIKGFGPTSALKLVNQNNVSEIMEARKTGNIYKLNSEGIKPSILSLIINTENRNTDAEVILIKNSLEKYGFKSYEITQAIKTHYNPSKKIDKNIISIIKAINDEK